MSFFVPKSFHSPHAILPLFRHCIRLIRSRTSYQTSLVSHCPPTKHTLLASQHCDSLSSSLTHGSFHYERRFLRDLYIQTFLCFKGRTDRLLSEVWQDVSLGRIGIARWIAIMPSAVLRFKKFTPTRRSGPSISDKATVSHSFGFGSRRLTYEVPTQLLSSRIKY